MHADSTRPQGHRRKAVRLSGYDYRQAGHYFVTICTEHRLHQFGVVRNGQMLRNDVGNMVSRVWNELPPSFPGIELDTMVLMPDHLHGIIVLGCDPASPADHKLGDVVRYYKGRSNTEYFKGVRESVWKPVPGRLWQLQYFDRIVRSERELAAIREYIEANPSRWEARRKSVD